jgi:hypothetical protein
VKLSSIIKGTLIGASFVVAALCPLAGAVGGAILGATAASSAGGAIGLGVLGLIGGSIAGSIAGEVVALPGQLYLGVKGIKAIFKHEDRFFQSFESNHTQARVSTLTMKSDFDTASSGLSLIDNMPKLPPMPRMPRMPKF